MDLIIEHQCPQCGASVVLSETDRLIACEFCRVKSYLLQKEYFRYMLPTHAPDSKELIYFPYWRYKGMLFSCISSGIRDQFVDLSYQAVKSSLFPVSAGLRTQALKMKFVTSATKGYFLNITQPLDNVVDTLDNRFKRKLKDTVYHQAHIGENLSLIYSPFYLEGRLYDGILNEPVISTLPREFNIESYPGGKPDWKTQFIPTLCPSCGWDLEGERDALILHCKNCNSAWRSNSRGFKNVNFVSVPSKTKNSIYLPFWRIKSDISNLTLNTFADLIKVANLPKAINVQHKDIGFRFWSPAFKVRPRVFLRLSSNITLIQPQMTMKPELPGSHYPVTLPITEAIEGLKITLASFIKPSNYFFPKLEEIAIKPIKFLLVYLPFHEGSHEYIQEEFNFAINKNHLSLSKNL